ncbi:hypothetical protein [Sneathiella sp.]|nr:hypothetical protein [Sneathiella sp.]
MRIIINKADSEKPPNTRKSGQISTWHRASKPGFRIAMLMADMARQKQ